MAFLLQKIADNGLKKSSFGPYKEWNDIIQGNINADVVIQGSSRAMVQISPEILDSALHLNSYNLGMNGWQFYMQYYRFMLYLRHNRKPKYIIQNIDHATLAKTPNFFDPEQFLPYLEIDIIEEAVAPFSSFDWKDFTIPMYKYRGKYQLYAQGFVNNFRRVPLDNERYKGFEAQNLPWDSSFRRYKKTVPNGLYVNLDKETQFLFEKFLEQCRVNKIKVIFVYAPTYIEAQNLFLNRDSITNIFKNYARKYDIPLFDYSNDSICLDTMNFYNSHHLNSTGVKKFNLKFVGDLNEAIGF